MVQTILGSGGAIGIDLARELKNYDTRIRLVSRNPQKVNLDDELFPLDVYNLSQIEGAISGSDIVYVTIGFKYSAKEWKKIWPDFMNEVIGACKKQNAKLVFFDNMYLYSKTAVPFMTEDSPINPPGKKGAVRKILHEMIMNEVEKQNLTAQIVRSADFYGPNNKNSLLSIMVADPLMKGKKAQAFGDINKVHTFTFTPDAAKATALLGNTPDAYNQVWHVPTTKERLTTRDWIELVAGELHRKASVQTIPKWMIHILGIFIPVMREFPEMLYQNEQDYVFNSSKFEKRFGLAATSPKEGVRIMVQELLQKTSDNK